MIKKSLILILLVFLSIYIYLIFFYPYNKEILNKLKLSDNSFYSEYSYIAHAGGGIEGNTYTNSKEALLQSINNHFKLIEIDLLVTSDKKILGYHDWHSLSEMCNFDKEKIKTFKLDLIKKCNFLLDDKNYTFLDDQLINKIFSENDKLVLVTDKISDFSLIKKKFDFNNRIIVETFGINNYLKAKLYRVGNPMYNFTIGRRNDWYVKMFNIKFIATSADNVVRYRDLFQKYIKEGRIIFAYSSNDTNFNKQNIGSTVSAVYTDFWNIKLGECSIINNSPDLCVKY